MTGIGLPRWRGFNLHQMFSTSSRWGELMPMDDHRVQEDDVRWLADWGFDFVRVPVSYLLLIGDSSRRTFPEERLAILDRVVGFGERYHVHVSLNLWRAPGHTNFGYPYNEPEVGSLWTDDGLGSRELFAGLWSTLAARYRGIPSERLSFDLVNEPPATALVPGVSDADVLLTYESAVRAVRSVDPERTVLVEGLDWGGRPVPADWCERNGVAQSVHGFVPLAVSHHRCAYMPTGLDVSRVPPTWPMDLDLDLVGPDVDVPPELALMRDRGVAGPRRWDRDEIARWLRPWFDTVAGGVGVHAGETGVHRAVPHDVAMGWLDDTLSLLTENGIGYALWNLRGPFGVLDSGRDDVAYEDWHGHRLDRRMLDLLQKY